MAYGAGELDPTFDGDGRVLTAFGASKVDAASGLAVQGDGKLIAAGTSGVKGDAGSYDFAVARYRADGSLDPSFDGDGGVLTDFFGTDEGRAVAIQADGEVVVAGNSYPLGNADFALARLNPDGSLDPTFDLDGKVVTDLGGEDTASDIAIQGDGKIVVAGSSAGNFALVRYNPDGSLDSSFEGDGKVLTDFFGASDTLRSVAIQGDGKIVTAGSSETGPFASNFALARYTAAGSLDSSFSGDGRVLTDFFGDYDAANGVALQVDGKIVAAGWSTTQDSTQPALFTVARYGTNGSLDPSFSSDGRVATRLSGSGARAYAVAIQDDGKIVAAGVTGWPEFALVRYMPDGNLDPNFDFDGRVTTGFGAGPDEARDVAIQPDGKIVAAGWHADDSGDQSNFALARYLATGTTLPKISIYDIKSFEGNAGLTEFRFTVDLSTASSQTITVTRQTANGSASAPADYTALGPATFTFSPGQTTKTAIVKVNGEVSIEPNETFFVNLSNATNATIADGTGLGTILNDDLSDSAPCTITGTNRNDVLNGTPGNDVICGRRGDDQVFGLGGNDVLKAEDGNDLLVGGNGYDLLLGAAGIDDLRGEAGNDTLRAGDSGDTLNGAAGSDALFGDSGADSLNAQDGVAANDSADGGADSDSCVFDSGDFVTSCP